MAGVTLNLDFSGERSGGGASGGRAEQGNKKHRRFNKRRKFLEKLGYLKQKQLPPKPAKKKQPNSWDQTNQNAQLGDHSQRTQKSNVNFFQTHQQGATSSAGALENAGLSHKKLNNHLFHSHQQGAPFSAGAPENAGLSQKKLNNHLFHSHQQGAPSSAGAPDNATPSQRTQKKSNINFFQSHQQSVAPNPSRSAAPTSGPAPPPLVANGHAAPGAKDQPKPSLQLPAASLLSEFSSGLTPSYKIVAIDCEMVGTGPKGSISALARCSIVGYHGDLVYDKYIKPATFVTDYRTRWSGIRREHLANATPFVTAQKEILKILQGKTVIGHAIQNDYKALGYFHPKEMTRDTSRIPLLNRKAGFPEKEAASLKRLAKQLLRKDIQTGKGGHCSVEDAKTTMELYRVVEAEYERELASGQGQ